MRRCLVGIALCASALQAVDGIVLIDQNRAMAGNVTPGDAPGFPVTISLPGSYRLSGNLTLPNQPTWAIEVTSHVTLDLNGFAILGAVNCASFPCQTAQGYPSVHNGGIRQIGSSQFNITIRNGTIQGMGAAGVFLTGGSFVVEDLHVRSNAGGGIAIYGADGYSTGGVLIRRNRVDRNGGRGIGSESGLISENFVENNLDQGIDLTRYSGRIERNIVYAPGYPSSYGMIFGPHVSVSGNVVTTVTDRCVNHPGNTALGDKTSLCHKIFPGGGGQTFYF